MRDRYFSHPAAIWCDRRTDKDRSIAPRYTYVHHRVQEVAEALEGVDDRPAYPDKPIPRIAVFLLLLDSIHDRRRSQDAVERLSDVVGFPSLQDPLCRFVLQTHCVPLLRLQHDYGRNALDRYRGSAIMVGLVDRSRNYRDEIIRIFADHLLRKEKMYRYVAFLSLQDISRAGSSDPRQRLARAAGMKRAEGATV